MKKWLLNNKLLFTGVFIGGIVGYLFYSYVGCTSGKCSIASNLYNSVIYFSLMGGIMANIFKPIVPEEDQNEADY